MGTEKQDAPYKWVFFSSDDNSDMREDGDQDVFGGADFIIRRKNNPRAGVYLPVQGARRLYEDLRKGFEPIDKRPIEILNAKNARLEKELAALKDQRRWELYLALTEKFFGTGPNYLLGEKVQSFAIDVDKHVKAYVNTVMPAE